MYDGRQRMPPILAGVRSLGVVRIRSLQRWGWPRAQLVPAPVYSYRALGLKLRRSIWFALGVLGSFASPVDQLTPHWHARPAAAAAIAVE